MLRIESLSVDADDPAALAGFWAELLGGTIHEEDGEVWIEFASGDTAILFVPGSDEQVVKNRLHLDLRPDDRDAEVARALAMGARHVDIGQTGEETWVVLADPEGNEFCILSGRPAS